MSNVIVGFLFAAVFILMCVWLFLAGLRRMRRMREDAARAEWEFERTTAHLRRAKDPPDAPAADPAGGATALRPPSSAQVPALAPPDGARSGPVAAVERKLQIAGLISGPGDRILTPGGAEPSAAHRLRNRKSFLIVPEDAPDDWVQSQSRFYDYVCVAGAAQAKVLRRFEDFLADMMVM